MIAVPSTQQLVDEIVADLEASLSTTFPLLPKAFSRVLAKVLAGTTALLYRYVGWIALQLFVAHASFQEVTIGGKRIRPLVAWGVLVGVGEPAPATRAEVSITVRVTNQVGSLAAGSQLIHQDSGVIYSTTSVVALGAATVTVTARAVSDSSGGTGEGSIGNRVAGEILSFANPLANVATDATVNSISIAGTDAETGEAYRAKVIRRFQERPQGGAHADYRTWPLSVPGLVAVYPYAGRLPGDVDMYVEATADSSGSPDGIPTAAQLAAALEAVKFDAGGKATRLPANVRAVNVLPISRAGIRLRIADLHPDTPENRALIQSGVDEYLRSREPFIVGVSVLPRKDRVTQAAVSGIVDDLVNAVDASVAKIKITPGPALTLEAGQKAKLILPAVFGAATDAEFQNA